MPAAGGSRSIACVQGMEEGVKGRTTTEVRSGGGGVAHTLSFAGRDTEVKEAVGTPAEEKASGNASFAAKDFTAAEKHYSKAIEQLEAQSSDPAAAEVRAIHSRSNGCVRPQQTRPRVLRSPASSHLTRTVVAPW